MASPSASAAAWPSAPPRSKEPSLGFTFRQPSRRLPRRKTSCPTRTGKRLAPVFGAQGEDPMQSLKSPSGAAPASSPPAEDAPQDRTRPADGPRFYSSGDVRILVVDDDPAIGRLIKAAF